MRAPTLAALQAELERASWSGACLDARLARALALADTLHPADRCAWLVGLRRAHAAGALQATAQCVLALELAGRWCDWPLVDALCAALEAMRSRRDGLSPVEEGAWVHALHRIGRSEIALDRCRRRMLAHPHEHWPAAAYASLCAWQRFVAASAPAIEGESLRLEPLGHQHLQDFAWQYYDPDIATLCCLPRFADDGEWRAWLDTCWSYGDQRLYAVLHAEWGFIGSVSLILHDGVGFFYYWLGPDFQGHGLGPAAVALLLADAEARDGMTTCYAKVFEHNLRSRRGLERLGFAALDCQPAPPNDNERFYRLGPPQAREASVAELRRLLAQMGSEARIAVPARALVTVGRRVCDAPHRRADSTSAHDACRLPVDAPDP